MIADVGVGVASSVSSVPARRSSARLLIVRNGTSVGVTMNKPMAASEIGGNILSELG